MQQMTMIGTLRLNVSVGVQGSGRPGLALIVLSVVEQRLDAVRAVLAGAEVTEDGGVASSAISQAVNHR